MSEKKRFFDYASDFPILEASIPAYANSDKKFRSAKFHKDIQKQREARLSIRKETGDIKWYQNEQVKKEATRTGVWLSTLYTKMSEQIAQEMSPPAAAKDETTKAATVKDETAQKKTTQKKLTNSKPKKNIIVNIPRDWGDPDDFFCDETEEDEVVEDDERGNWLRYLSDIENLDYSDLDEREERLKKIEESEKKDRKRKEKERFEELKPQWIKETERDAAYKLKMLFLEKREVMLFNQGYGEDEINQMTKNYDDDWNNAYNGVKGLTKYKDKTYEGIRNSINDSLANEYDPIETLKKVIADLPRGVYLNENFELCANTSQNKGGESNSRALHLDSELITALRDELRMDVNLKSRKEIRALIFDYERTPDEDVKKSMQAHEK